MACNTAYRKVQRTVWKIVKRMLAEGEGQSGLQIESGIHNNDAIEGWKGKPLVLKPCHTTTSVKVLCTSRRILVYPTHLKQMAFNSSDFHSGPLICTLLSQ